MAQVSANTTGPKLIDQLHKRNQLQTLPFVSIVDSFQTLYKKVGRLQRKNQELERKLVIAQHESSASSTSTAQQQSSNSAQRQVVLLQEQIRTLKDELTQKYKNEASRATSQLELSSEVRALQKDLSLKRIEVGETKAELQNTRETVSMLEETVRGKDKVIQMLRGEVAEAQSMLRRSEERALKLQNENVLITERVMEEKMSLMEEMNRMTELNAEMQAKLQRLQEQSAAKQPGEHGILDPDWHLAASSAGQVESLRPPCDALHAFQAHETEIPTVAFNEDGGCFATGCSDGTVRVWTTESRDCQAVLRSDSVGTNAILCVDMHDKLLLGAGSDRSCRVWSLETERIMHKFTGHAGKVYAAGFTPDGKVVVTGGTDRKMMLWDVESGNRLRNISAGSTVNGLQVSPEGALVVTAHQDSKVRLWDLRQGTLVCAAQVHSAPVTSAKFSMDSSLVLTNSLDNKLQVLDVKMLKVKHTLTNREYRPRTSLARSSLSPNAAFALAGSVDGSIYIWEVESQRTNSVLRTHTSPVIGTCWSPNGKHVASCDQSGWVVIWTS